VSPEYTTDLQRLVEKENKREEMRSNVESIGDMRWEIMSQDSRSWADTYIFLRSYHFLHILE
jgi:hypothetical protein